MKIRFEYFLLGGILVLAAFTRVYNLEMRSPFGWDQARDAEAVWQILKVGKPTLIGPQVVSGDAFFLGPLWFYLLIPFYFLFNMNPFGASVAVVLSGAITVLAIYLFFKKIAGIKVAVLASIIWATISDVTAWNPMLIPIFEIGILYTLIKIADGKKKFIIFAFILFGLGLQIHFQMVFLFIPFLFSIYINLKEKLKLPIQELLYGAGLFVIIFIPLIIFELRHNFINSRGFLKLFGIGVNNPHNSINFFYQFTITFPKFISTATFFLPSLSVSRVMLGLVILICSIVGILSLSIPKSQQAILISIITLPILFFSLYSGNLSEYYFTLCSIPILLGFTNFLWKISELLVAGRLAVILFMIWVSTFNIKQIILGNDGTSLYYQKQAVEYLKNQTEDKIINVSFDVPVNSDSGFKYLFKYYNLNPQNIPEGHLWTIVIPPNADNIIPNATFGNIGVIRR